jgi:hypothetical protein
MRRTRPFESPSAFARACIQLAIAVAALGITRLVDPLFALPLAAMLLLFAALARLADSDRLDDPDVPAAQPAPSEAADTSKVERTFRLPVSVGAERACVVGDFNDWSLTSHPMRRGSTWFTAVVELEAGRSYRYRYLLDGSRWENDWNADRYVPNDHGTDDSVALT